jgi:Acyl-CoA synthetases (AMP-forming)/AMP-acid ligases II
VNTPPDVLLAAWEKSLTENRGRTAVLDHHGRIRRTFDDVEQRAKRFEQELQSLGGGEVVAIQIGNHPDWPSLFIACLRKRLVVLPLEQTISSQHREAAFENCGVAATAVLGSADNVKIASVTRPAGTIIDWQKLQPTVLKLTSGTTAKPRTVRFRSSQLLADCENICDTMEITARDLNYGAIPISHSYGFSNLLTPLLARGVAMVLSTDRIPRAIVDGLASSRATVFPGMPVFYQSLCELNNIPSLPELRLCISAGAPLSPELADKFRERFGREIHIFYGSSECGGICYARKPEPLPGFVGQPLKGVHLELLEGDRGASRIRIRSRAVGDAYFPEPDQSSLSEGTFVPDDLLEGTTQGYRIVGRASDLINVAGKKVNPAEVEIAILSCAGVREAIAFGCKSNRRYEEVVACVVTTGQISEAQLLADLRSRLSSWQVPRRIYFVDVIPVNERGKTSRRDLARRFQGDG